MQTKRCFPNHLIPHYWCVIALLVNKIVTIGAAATTNLQLARRLLSQIYICAHSAQFNHRRRRSLDQIDGLFASFGFRLLLMLA